MTGGIFACIFSCILLTGLFHTSACGIRGCQSITWKDHQSNKFMWIVPFSTLFCSLPSRCQKPWYVTPKCACTLLLPTIILCRTCCQFTNSLWFIKRHWCFRTMSRHVILGLFSCLFIFSISDIILFPWNVERATGQLSFLYSVKNLSKYSVLFKLGTGILTCL